MLTSAGVVDTGTALRAAVRMGQEASVKCLLQQNESKDSGQRAVYLDTCDPSSGRTPLICSIKVFGLGSPRITRLLVDAGADTTTGVQLTETASSRVFFKGTPLAFANFQLRSLAKRRKTGVTESQLHNLKAIRRLLMRVEAVHAVSWLWVSDLPSITHDLTGGTGKPRATPTPLAFTLPTLRRGTASPRVVFAAMSRWAVRRLLLF